MGWRRGIYFKVIVEVLIVEGVFKGNRIGFIIEFGRIFGDKGGGGLEK